MSGRVGVIEWYSGIQETEAEQQDIYNNHVSDSNQQIYVKWTVYAVKPALKGTSI